MEALAGDRDARGEGASCTGATTKLHEVGWRPSSTDGAMVGDRNEEEKARPWLDLNQGGGEGGAAPCDEGKGGGSREALRATNRRWRVVWGHGCPNPAMAGLAAARDARARRGVADNGIQWRRSTISWSWARRRSPVSEEGGGDRRGGSTAGGAGGVRGKKV